jgi:serine/threonine protein kinase
MMRDAHHINVTPSSNANKLYPHRNFAEGHTAGVGTASYAAPEQITENDYGPKVDIFALGVILLELFSNFTSEHERAKAFYNLRHCRELEPRIHQTYPEVASLVLACTQTDPRQRPTASDILNIGVFHEGNSSELVTALKSEIDQRDDLIDKQNDLLREKDREIEELKQRLMQVEVGKSMLVTNELITQGDEKDSTSSSDADY